MFLIYSRRKLPPFPLSPLPPAENLRIWVTSGRIPISPNKERVAMTMKRVLFGAMTGLMTTCVAMAQANAQQPGRTRTEPQQPPAQMTVPEAQQPQQQRERQRTRNPMESQPQLQRSEERRVGKEERARWA